MRKEEYLNSRVIDTGLSTALEADIIDAVFGQVSDGMWENSSASDHYWPYISVEKRGNKVVLLVSKEYRDRNWKTNRFVDMDDASIKKWVARRIKLVIKEEGLDWTRDNTEETDYLSTDWRSSKQSATVADCYYVYEVLKGRNVKKHPEYQKTTMSLGNALKTLKDNQIPYENDEPWDLDESKKV